MKKKRNGLYKALLGLTLGLGIGVGILALKSYSAKLLVAYLDDQVKRSCDCYFTVDTVAVNFLPTINAYATNARIVSNQDQQTKLIFKSISIKAGLSRIKDHVIELYDLRLKNGKATDVDENSATFKFIDFLTEPPQHDYPGRWKASLINLQLINSELTQPLGRHLLVAKGVELAMQRKGESFFLTPSIEKITTLTPSQRFPGKNTETLIGNLNGKVIITDGIVQFRGITVANKSAKVVANAEDFIKQKNKLVGDLNFVLDNQSLDLPQYISGKIQGQAKIYGVISNPSISGEFKIPDQANLEVDYGLGKLAFQNLAAKFKLLEIGEDLSLEINEVNASGAKVQAKILQPIIINDRQFDGQVQLSIKESAIDFAQANQVEANLKLNQNPKNPGFDLSGIAQNLSYENYRTPAFDFNLRMLSNNARKDTLNFELLQLDQKRGNFKTNGNLILEFQKPARFENFNFDFARLQILPPSKSSNVVPLKISGSGKLSGEADFKKLSGQAKIELSSEIFQNNATLSGDARFEAGVLSAEVSNQSASIKAQLKREFLANKKSSFVLSLNQFNPEEYNPKLECIEINANLNYEFGSDSILNGSGKLNLGEIRVGCQPYEIKNATPTQYTINDGILNLPKLELRGENSLLKINGEISSDSGFNLSSSGDLQLSSLVGLLPFFDDMRGKFVSQIKFTGPLSAPLLTGNAELKQAEFSIESANISANDVEGKFSLKDSSVKIDKLTGTFNQGTAQITGKIELNDLVKSNLECEFKDAHFNPDENSNIDLSGKILLKRNEHGGAILEGNLLLNEAAFEKNLDLRSLVKTISESIFSAKNIEFKAVNYPNLDLNIKLAAPRNLSLTTNWAALEMGGELQIAGTLAKPTLDGKLEVLSGWFGLKERRFDITSASIIFKPNQDEPYLELLSESVIRSTSFRNPSSDNTLLFVEANGPLSNPKVKLSSDQGLSEKEILALITTGSALASQSLDAFIIPASEQLDNPLYKQGFAGFIRMLAKIDSLTFEPAFNSQSGAFEPSIVARKNLSDKILIKAENLFGSYVRESKLTLGFILTPYLEIDAIIDSVSTENNAALRIDALYTVLERESPYLKIEIDGAKDFTTSEILSGIKINSNSSIRADEISNLEENLLRFLRANGYFKAKAKIICQDDDKYCRSLHITVEQEQLHYISQINYNTDQLADFLNKNSLNQIKTGGIASQEYLDWVQQNIREKLRSEGYLSSRIKTSYLPIPEKSSEVELLIDLNLGPAVSFEFVGNTVFSERELLDTINLFKRKQAFGNNTINILIQNIEQKYRRAGYLFATVSQTSARDPQTNRQIYHVEIEEGNKIPVDKVSFEGNLYLSTEQISELLNQRFKNLSSRVFYPKYAVAEEIDSYIQVIAEIYREEGFTNAQINYKLVPNDSDQNLEIIYLVKEGEKLNASQLEIIGYPQSINAAQLPKPPYSIAKANRYLETLIYDLKQAGYFQFEYYSDFDLANDKLKIEFTTGPQTVISAIKIEGNSSVASQTILNHIQIKENDAWDANKINSSQNRLIKLGLFSKLSLKPEDGQLDQEQEVLVIKVVERSLTNLELGGGIDSENGIHILGEGSDKSLFKDGRNISFRADLFYDSVDTNFSKGLASLKYSDPEIFGSNYRLTEDLRFQKFERANQEYDLERISLSSYIYQSINTNYSFTFGHTLAHEKVSNVESDIILSELDQGNLLLSYLSGVFGYDARDDTLNPSSGFDAVLDYKLSSLALGSDADFFASSAKFSFIYPLFFNLRYTIANNSRLGFAQPFGGTQDIPITQRYYLGGRNTVRGFRENSLGPRGNLENVIGGDLLVSNSFEFRYMLAENTQIHTFLDMGTVYLKDESLSIDDMRWSTGFGMRFTSPIGPIGLDLGFPIDEQKGEPSMRLHFNIGSTF